MVFTDYRSLISRKERYGNINDLYTEHCAYNCDNCTGVFSANTRLVWTGIWTKSFPINYEYCATSINFRIGDEVSDIR